MPRGHKFIYRVSGTGVVAFTGYSEHQCREVDRFFRFTDKWRVYDGKNASESIKISEEETIPGRVVNYDHVSYRRDPYLNSRNNIMIW